MPWLPETTRHRLSASLTRSDRLLESFLWLKEVNGRNLMNTIAITQVRNDLYNIVNRTFCINERTIIAKKGKNVAAVIGMEYLDFLENMEKAEDMVLAEMADEAMKESGENISLQEMKKHFGRC
jgi:PHD/YefM family antitoxin component YafN of YafNO toxin-antitoxin module